MEILGLVALLLPLGLVILPIVLAFGVSSRLANVERSLARIARTLEEASCMDTPWVAGRRTERHGRGEVPLPTHPDGGAGVPDPTTPADAMRDGDLDPLPPPIPDIPPPLPTATPAGGRTLEVEDHMGAILAWLKDDWILKLGALLLFAGLGWFVAYAAWNNWISPQVRILGAIGLGTAFSVHGWRGLGTGSKGAATFLALGTAVILAATFAGRVRHDLGSPAVALAVMFAAAAVPALASIRHDMPSLGRLALGAAMAAPLLTSPPSPNWPGLFGALAAVVGGFAWVGRRNGDAVLQWIAFGGVALYAVSLWSLSPGYWDAYDPRHGIIGVAGAEAARALADSVVPFAYAICAIFLAALTSSGAAAARAGGFADSGRARRGLVALWLVGGFFAAWTGWGIPPSGQKFLLGAGALAFLGTGLFAFQSGGYRALLAHWSAAFALAAVALDKTLDFPALTVALAVAGVAATGGSYLLTKNSRAALLASLSLLPAIGGAFHSLSSTEWPSGNWGPDAISILVGAATALAGAFFLGKIAGNEARDRELLPRSSHVLALAGAVLLLALAWLLAQALLPGGAGTAACLVLYSAAGIAAHYAGAVLRHPCLRRYGTILILLVAARLLVVEVWNMDTPHRIAAFIAVGTILLAAAKFARKWDGQEIGAEPPGGDGQD